MSLRYVLRPDKPAGMFSSPLETNDCAFQREVGAIERVDETEEGSQGCCRFRIVARQREDR